MTAPLSTVTAMPIFRPDISTAPAWPCFMYLALRRDTALGSPEDTGVISTMYTDMES